MATSGSEDEGFDFGPCGELIDCVSETQPAQAEALIELYGPDGLCYADPDETVESCWSHCQFALDEHVNMYPDNPYCNGAECAEDSDCEDPAQPSCWTSTWECGPQCGDGKLNPGEQCDPGADQACSATCTLDNHDCSPLDNSGCAANEKCTVSADPGGSGQTLFVCAPDFIGPGQLGDPCMAQSECSLSAPLCAAGVNGCSNGDLDQCCVSYCYLGESELPDCPAPLSCQAIDLQIPGPLMSGLEQFGVCF